MKTFEPTEEVIATHAALLRAKEAFDIRLNAFSIEAVRAIDDIANQMGKPVWHKPTSVFAGDVTGYLFDFVESMLVITGYICVSHEGDAGDDGETVEISVEDALFDEPKKPRKRKGAKDAE